MTEEEKAALREQNRKDMPLTTEFMDRVKKYDKPTYGCFTENGKTVEWGKRTVP